MTHKILKRRCDGNVKSVNALEAGNQKTGIGTYRELLRRTGGYVLDMYRCSEPSVKLWGWLISSSANVRRGGQSDAVNTSCKARHSKCQGSCSGICEGFWHSQSFRGNCFQEKKAKSPILSSNCTAGICVLASTASFAASQHGMHSCMPLDHCRKWQVTLAMGSGTPGSPSAGKLVQGAQ